MYILDSHIHMWGDYRTDEEIIARREGYLKDLALAGVDGTQVMSPDPRTSPMNFEERMHALFTFCGDQDNLYPFFWLDPSKDGFLEEIDRADEMGISGYKIICSGFYPSDENVIAACTRIAEKNKPVLFHSGILWDGHDSARYNRPGEYECLLEVPNLRFCLAHVSWPWTDECIAVYGKFNNAFLQRPELSCEMFIDITPGTPHVYREEVFKRLFGSDYQVKYNVMFGTDCNTHKYNVAWTREWLEQDIELIRRFNPDDAETVLEHVYAKNFLRFMGKSDEKIERIFPDVAV